MKDIKTYIDDTIIEEGLLKWFKAFFKKMYDRYDEYTNHGTNIEKVDMAKEKIKTPKDSISLTQSEAKEAIKGWKEKAGYPQIAKLLRKINGPSSKYYGLREENIYVYEYVYKGEIKTPAALILYCRNYVKKDNYVHLLYFEIHRSVDNYSEVMHFVFNDFVEKMKAKNTKNESYKGITAYANKDIYPAFEQMLTSLEFEEVKQDEDAIHGDYEDLYQLNF